MSSEPENSLQLMLGCKIRQRVDHRVHAVALALASVAFAACAGAVYAQPTIEITEVPPYAVDGFIQGHVTGVDLAISKVAPYIYVEGLGWYTKPGDAQSTVPINGNGRFSADVATDGDAGLDNRALIYCAMLVPAAHSPLDASGAKRVPDDPAALALTCVERYGRTIEFAGRQWAVKSAPQPVGPGWNRFSDATGDVFVDASGRLHLTVNNHDGFWWATEVILLGGPLRYGTYWFQTASRLDRLDANVTFGAFTWDAYGDDASIPSWPNREIDFEDSRWGRPSDNTNAQEVVQPYFVSESLRRYTIPDLAAGSALTRFFEWRADHIHFVALLGYHSPVQYRPADVIAGSEWLYTHQPSINHIVPSPGRATFRFNLWPNNVEIGGSPPPQPSALQPVEVVITRFGFAAAPLTATPTTAATTTTSAAAPTQTPTHTRAGRRRQRTSPTPPRW